MKRVFLKLSGEALAGEKHTGFDEPTVTEVARQVKQITDQGIQVGIVIGRLNQHGLTGGAQGLELILEPNAVTVALDDVGEPLRVAKGTRSTGATVVVGLAARLLNVKYQRHGLYLQRHDLGAMELGDA